jgi:hypothetical protein
VNDGLFTIILSKGILGTAYPKAFAEASEREDAERSR